MSGFMATLSEAVQSLWRRLTGSSPAHDPNPRDLRSLEELRHLVMDLLTNDPITYLGYQPTEIRAVGPGTTLGSLELDFHGVLIASASQMHIENVDRILAQLGPAFSLESLKSLLRARGRAGPEVQGAGFIPWSDVSGLLLPTLHGQEQPHALNAVWGDLFVTPAADLPNHSLLPVGELHMQQWSITANELLSAAMSNLTERYGDIRALPADPAETGGLNIWTVTSAPHLNASLSLLPGVVASVPLPMDRMYVAVPDRSSLLFIEQPDSLEQRQALLEAVFGMWWEAAHRVSPYLYIWWDGELVKASAEAILGQTEAALYQGVVHFTYPGEQEPYTLTLPVGRGY